MAPAMPCKISKNNQICGNGDKSNKTKSKLACILEASESTRPRMGLQHYNFVHKFIPMHQAMKIPAAKAGMGKIGDNSGVEPDESQK